MQLLRVKDGFITVDSIISFQPWKIEAKQVKPRIGVTTIDGKSHVLCEIDGNFAFESGQWIDSLIQYLKSNVYKIPGIDGTAKLPTQKRATKSRSGKTKEKENNG